MRSMKKYTRVNAFTKGEVARLRCDPFARFVKHDNYLVLLQAYIESLNKLKCAGEKVNELRTQLRQDR